MGVATSRGKLLLFGEHSAVYGHPAVGLSLPWKLTVSHTQADDWQLPGLGPHKARVRSLLGWFEARATMEGLPSPPLGRLVFETDIPLSSGFGSSGALCAALVNLFFPNLVLAERDRLAWLAEGLFHGTPSGIDTALALREGWWALDASQRPVVASPLTDPGLNLVTGSLVRTGDTKALVQGLATRRADGEALVIDSLEGLGAIARAALQGWNNHDADALCDLMRHARAALQRLGLETPTLTTVLDAALNMPGAQAAKLSGAGGGGAFVVAFRDRPSAERALPLLSAVAPEAEWTARPRLI